jgi:hypothetical protein
MGDEFIPQAATLPPGRSLLWVITAMLIAFFAPNTPQFMQNFDPAIQNYRGELRPIRRMIFLWRPTKTWAVCTGCAAVLALSYINRVSEFLYYQF